MRRLLDMLFIVALYALFVAAAFLLAPKPAHSAPAWLYPPSRINDTTSVLYWHPRTKPAVGATFIDSAYSTAYQRITTDTNLANDNGPVPIYSQIQAWNADQTRIMFGNGLLMSSPGYQTIAEAPLPGNFRWSPIYPDTGYYSKNRYSGGVPTGRPQFMAVHAQNRGERVVRTFNEYLALEISEEWEDVSRDGRKVVLGGYKHCSPSGNCPSATGDCNGCSVDTIQVRINLSSGNPNLLPTSGSGQTDSLEIGAGVFGPGIPIGCKITGINRGSKVVTISPAPTSSTTGATVAFTNEDIFWLDVITGAKGRVVPGWSNAGCGAVDDMLMSPKGDYMILHFGAGGTDTLSCGVIAFDTTGVYAGKVSGSAAHYDLTIGSDSLQYWVGGTGSADQGPSDPCISKALIPNGINLWLANHATGVTELTPYPFQGQGGGIHVSGRAYGAGWVIVSTDDDFDTRQAPTVFRNELVKVYLDSRRKNSGNLHIERLVDTQTYPYGVNHSTCALSKYWAAPHATISRDGTRVLWGSVFMDSVNCPGESYVMDISNRGRNETLISMTPNTWRKMSPRSYKFDGTREVSDRFPSMPFSRGIGSPEYGGMFHWGGGGDGADRMGNDIWRYTGDDSTWRQYTQGDLDCTTYPGVITGPCRNQMDTETYCNNVNAGALCPGYATPNTCSPNSIYLPPGSTSSGTPWSSHIMGQRTWDSVTRRYVMGGPNALWDSPGQQFYLDAPASYYFDPYLKRWTYIGTYDEYGHGGGMMAFDPVQKKVLSVCKGQWKAHGGGSLFCPIRHVLDGTTYASWPEVTPRPTFTMTPDFGDGVYDQENGKILSYGCQLCGAVPAPQRVYRYDMGTGAMDTLNTLPDPTFGKPPFGGPSQAYDGKNKRLYIYGYEGGGVPRIPLWYLDVTTSRWTKVVPATSVDPFTVAGADDANPTLASDPTNNVIYMFRHDASVGYQTIGDFANSGVGELWVYKPSAGDGRRLEPVTYPFTGGGGGGGSCSSPGL